MELGSKIISRSVIYLFFPFAAKLKIPTSVFKFINFSSVAVLSSLFDFDKTRCFSLTVTEG